MKRALRGYILIDEKRHFVYEGLNIIGRHKEATVIIPNTSVSHYHSTIVIIENRHYLSDITSTNGTYLGEDKLSPLQLYELSTESVLKFGLVSATYFKLTNTPVDEFEDKNGTQIEEDILKADTQVYNASAMCNLNNSDIPSEKNNSPTRSKILSKADISNLITISINDMPTQIFTNDSDKSLNLNSNDEKRDTSSTNILLHDLPTQITRPTEDEELALIADRIENTENAKQYEKRKSSSGDILAVKDELNISLPEVSKFHETSLDIIEETVVEGNNDEDDESSRESTDFLTMQPASTQYFDSESQSQLCVQQLRRRIRNIIDSTDDDLSNCDGEKGEKSQEKHPRKTELSNNHVVSDDDTDVESSQITRRISLRKNKPIITSDSDGDSTDIEVTDNVTTISIHEAGRSTDINLNAPDKTIGENTDTDKKEENNLDDSDIIPTTQDFKPANSVSNFEVQDNIKDKKEKIDQNVVSENAILEESLADSFQLMLTNTPTGDLSQLQNDRKCDDNMPLLQDGCLKKPCDTVITEDKKNIFVEEKDKMEAVNANDANETAKLLCPNEQTDKCVKEADEVQHTQLEVTFDEPVSVKICNSRPSNPLVNVLETIENSEKDESVEDKLAKMFESQIEPIRSKEDNIFIQPTQILRPNEAVSSKDDDVFLMPTQRVAIKVPTDIDSKSNPKKDEIPILEKSRKDEIPSQVKIPSNLNTTDHENDDNDIFLQPTQIVTSEHVESNIVSEKSTSNKENEVDDIFLQPTQAAFDFEDAYTSSCDYYSNINHKLSSSDKIVENKTNLNSTDLKDDIFLQPTQELNPEVTNSTESGTDTTVQAQTKVVEDVFLQPTQIINNESNEAFRTDIDKSPISVYIQINDSKLVNVAKPSSENVDDQPDNNHLSALQGKSLSESKNSDDIDVGNFGDGVSVGQKKSEMLIESKLVSSKSSLNKEIEVESKNKDAKGKVSIDNQMNQENDNVNDKDQSKDIVVRRSARKQLMNNNHTSKKDINQDVINNKPDDVKQEGKASVSSKNKLFDSKDTRVSTRLKNKTLTKANKATIDTDSDNTDLEESAESKTISTNKKTAKILIENMPSSSTNANSLNKKVETNLTNENILQNAGKNRKSKHNDEHKQSEMVKKQRIDNNENDREVKNKESSNKGNTDDSATKESKPLRRSKRKLSTEEKSEGNDQTISKHERKLHLGKEINIPPKEDERPNVNNSTDSESEFVDTNRVIPSRTSHRTKRTVLNKNQNTNELISTKLTTTTRSKKSQIIDENESKCNKSNTRLGIERKSKQNQPTCIEKEDNRSNSASPSTSKTNSNDNKIKKQVRKHNETELSSTEDESSGPSISNVTITRASKSKKLKTETKETLQNSNENNPTCSSPSIAKYSAESLTRTSRRRRSLSKTSEDDFKINKSEKVNAPCTPERTKRVLKPKVIFTMLDSPQLETIIRSLGGFVVDSIETSTVLVTSCVKRSQKLLSAVGLSKPICSPKWLHDSKKANKFVDPWDYILEDEEAETKWNFSLRESLRRSANNKLLQNYTFQLMVNTAQDVLKGSIECCGGKCVSRAPAKDNQSNFIIVASPENKSKYARFLKQNPTPRIVTAEAIFDGVLRQELRFEQHLLT